MTNLVDTYKSYFEQAVKAAQYKITGGERYLWSSFGSNARFLDFDLNQKISLGLIFDTDTQALYQGSLFVGEKAYLWTNPEYVKAYKEECYVRGVDPRIAYDTTHYIECDVAEDFIEKIGEAFTAGVCSPYVKLSVDFSPEVQSFIDSQPEGFDLDAFVNEALRKEVDEVQYQNHQNIRAILKEFEKMSLSSAYIDMDAIIGRNNIPEILDWVASIVVQTQEKDIKIRYSNKEVREGLKHTLIIEPGSYTLDYFYKN